MKSSNYDEEDLKGTAMKDKFVTNIAKLMSKSHKSPVDQSIPLVMQKLREEAVRHVEASVKHGTRQAFINELTVELISRMVEPIVSVGIKEDVKAGIIYAHGSEEREELSDDASREDRARQRCYNSGGVDTDDPSF